MMMLILSSSSRCVLYTDYIKANWGIDQRDSAQSCVCCFVSVNLKTLLIELGNGVFKMLCKKNVRFIYNSKLMPLLQQEVVQRTTHHLPFSRQLPPLCSTQLANPKRLPMWPISITTLDKMNS